MIFSKMHRTTNWFALVSSWVNEEFKSMSVQNDMMTESKIGFLTCSI
jgi:hypothetical protein